MFGQKIFFYFFIDTMSEKRYKYYCTDNMSAKNEKISKIGI